MLVRLRNWWQRRQAGDDAFPDSEKSIDGSSPDQYVADTRLTDPKADRFGRLRFASRVAKTIADRRDSSSIVITISGKYGEGKSTALSFIEAELATHEHVVVVPFNPWRFTSEEALLVGFFRELAQAIGRRFTTAKEEIGKLINDYGDLATELVKFNYHGIDVSPGGAVRTLGKRLETVTIEQRKKRIEELLSKEHKRVVIVMDDIDRLERDEVQTIFRLIKLTADFPYTTYLLTFDQELVASAIGERFGQGDVAAGRSFLEKIVQVPLQLPKATHHDLVDFCLEHVQSALNATQQHLSDAEARDFQVNFHLYVAPRLETPRAAKRYANALSFAVPMLQGE